MLLPRIENILKILGLKRETKQENFKKTMKALKLFPESQTMIIPRRLLLEMS